MTKRKSKNWEYLKASGTSSSSSTIKKSSTLIRWFLCDLSMRDNLWHLIQTGEKTLSTGDSIKSPEHRLKKKGQKYNKEQTESSDKSTRKNELSQLSMDS